MLARGEKIGNYVLKRELGEGGMGFVYAARDADSGQPVAVKIPNGRVRSSDGLRRQFFLEGKALASVNHPNIVKVMTVLEEGDPPFIAMEYVEGRTLSDELKVRGTFTLQDTVAIVRPLADALDYIHHLKPRALVHRDVKPGNIKFRQEFDPVLLDFGIVQMDDHTSVAGAGAYWYMSPEQVKGQRVGGGSDQYSLAVVAYEMLTGRVPFEGPSYEVIRKHVDSEPPLPDGWNGAVKEVFRIALSKDASGRFPSCRAFADALDGASLGYLPMQPGSTTPQPVQMLSRGRWPRVAAAVLGGLVLLGLFISSLRTGHVRRADSVVPLSPLGSIPPAINAPGSAPVAGDFPAAGGRASDTVPDSQARQDVPVAKKAPIASVPHSDSPASQSVAEVSAPPPTAAPPAPLSPPPFIRQISPNPVAAPESRSFAVVGSGFRDDMRVVFGPAEGASVGLPVRDVTESSFNITLNLSRPGDYLLGVTTPAGASQFQFTVTAPLAASLKALPPPPPRVETLISNKCPTLAPNGQLATFSSGGDCEMGQVVARPVPGINSVSLVHKYSFHVNVREHVTLTVDASRGRQRFTPLLLLYDQISDTLARSVPLGAAGAQITLELNPGDYVALVTSAGRTGGQYILELKQGE